MSIWPSSIASNSNLYVAVDFPNSVTSLNGTINSSVTSITVTNATNYPSTGGFILIDSELIKYAGTSGNTLTGCLRGQDGTLPATHLNNAIVNLVAMAEHHNVLKDEIIAIETSLNLTPSIALISNGSGRVDVSSTTSTELGYVHGVTSSIQTQLNGKQASLGYTPVNKAGDSMSGNLTFLNQNAILFQDTGTNTITVEAPATISLSYTLKLPTTQGASSTFLQNDGSGNLTWAPASGSSGVTSITGTAHQIIASASTGAVTLSTPQNIDTTSSPTFAGLSLTGDESISVNTTNVSEVLLNLTNTGVAGQSAIQFHAASSATYYLGINPNLASAIVLSATSNVGDGNGLIFSGGSGIWQLQTAHEIVLNPGSTVLVSTGNLQVLSGSVEASSALFQNTTDQIVLGNTHTTTINAVAPAASRIYTIPDALTAANFVLSAPYVSLTGQTSSITTTTLFTPAVTGTYRISTYIVDTAGTIFTLQGTIGWTDDSTAQTANTSTLTNTTNGYLQSSFFIEATSGNAVTYAVALTGTATYNLYIVAERLS